MDTPADPFEYFFNLPWSDGLPIVTPTQERIENMLGGTVRPRDERLGLMPPALNEVTVETVAQHALMAGCTPEYLPVVLGVVEAVLIDKFNMNGIQANQNPGGPMIILNGPYAKKIGVQAGTGCLGPGFRANATIGRALRLLMMNMGGGIPGITDMSCFGSPVKFTFCVRENEEESPWHSLAVDRGFAQDEDAITLFAAEGPHLASDHASSEPNGILTTISTVMTSMGAINSYSRQHMLIAMGPHHATLLDRAGLSRQDVKQILYEKARLPLGLMKQGGQYFGIEKAKWPEWVNMNDDKSMVPMIHDPEDILLIVAGGSPGLQTLIVPGGNKNSRTLTIPYRTE